MASYQPAKKNTAFIFYLSLVSQANTKIMQVNPTLAAADFNVSGDGGALAALGTTPTVTPAAGRMVKVSLSAAEMNFDNVTLVCSDNAGAEWCDLTINIQTAARQIDDLAYPATSGRSMVVDANGLVDANAVKVGPTGAGTAQTAGDIMADTNDIQTRLPAALLGGRMDASVGAMAANVLTATAINADAITDAKVAADVTIASVTGAVGSVTAGVTVTTNNDKTGYGLSAAAVQAVWDALTAALTTVGSIGKKLADWTIGTAQTGDSFARLGAPAGVSVSADIAAVKVDTAAILVDTAEIGAAGAGLTALGDARIANLDATVSSRSSAAALATVQADTDDLQVKIGVAGAGLTAIGDVRLANLDATISSRTKPADTQARVTLVDTVTTYTGNTPQTGDVFPLASTEIADIKAKTDNLPVDPADQSLIIAATTAISAAIAALNNLSAAQVNAEVVDALTVDTYAEPGQGTPGATTTLAVKIAYLYKFLRNRVTQDATTLKVYADNAVTVDQKAAVSDDGTTYDRGEIGTGP